MATPILEEAAIFNAARQIQETDARRRYLDEVCGQDTHLRARIDALLHVHDHQQTFLEAPAVPMLAPTDASVSEAPGTQIGTYQLLEQIGEGGFGVVFVAEQQHPLRRTVALKIIKPEWTRATSSRALRSNGRRWR